MKSLLRAIYRPVLNRYYTNKRTSAVLYVLQFLPVVLVGLFCAIFVNSFFWIVLVVIIACGFIDYLAFDAFLDELSWRLLWSHFYAGEAKPHTPEQDVMKTFEKKPTPQNYETLANRLKNKESRPPAA